MIALAFYAMSTFEGPMMSIKTVNALSITPTGLWVRTLRRTGLEVGMVTMGSLYVLIPRLWGRQSMYSVQLISVHFWLATIGVVFYITIHVVLRHYPGSDVALLPTRMAR